MKIGYLIVSLAIFSTLVGVYFFGVSDSTDFLSYLTPLWNFFQGLTNILRTVWQFFLDFVGFIGDILPQPTMEVI